jgi:hypothetical protein
MREQSPEKFFNRIVNQFWYGIMGWNEIWTPHCTNLKQHISLIADGEVVELPEDTEGLIFSNIPSFGGGMKLWNIQDKEGPGETKSFMSSRPSFVDALLNISDINNSDESLLLPSNDLDSKNTKGY